jgi:tetratricopeptide (TPR) repeat protein
LQQAVTAQPENLQARQLLALSFVGQEDYERAIPELEQIASAKPSGRGQPLPAESRLSANKALRQSARGLRRTGSRRPELALGPPSQRPGLRRSGEYDKSIEEFKAARQQQPNDATVRFSLGFLYWKTQRFAEAEVELAKAVDIDPNFREAKFYLADAYLTDQKPQQAIPLLQSILASGPELCPCARLDLGKAFYQTEHYPEAATELEQRSAWSQAAQKPTINLPASTKTQ